MADMKTTNPTFPHEEVMKRIIQVVRPFTNDARDLAMLTSTLACYALRFSQNQQGKTLDKEDFTKWCLNAFRNSNDEVARKILESN